MSEVNLIGGFYQAKSLPFSAQDAVNWLPVPSKAEGSRSPIKLRGLPGLSALTIQDEPAPGFPYILTRTHDTVSEVQTFNLPMPLGSQAGDLAIVINVSSTDPANIANLGYFFPDVYTGIPFGIAAGATNAAVSQMFRRTLTASDVASGMALGTTSAAPNRGRFITYVIKSSVISSPFQFNETAGSDLDFTDPPKAPTNFFSFGGNKVFCLGAYNCADFPFAGPISRTVSQYPLPFAQLGFEQAGVNIYGCYNVVDNMGSFDCPAWTVNGDTIAEGATSFVVSLQV